MHSISGNAVSSTTRADSGASRQGRVALGARLPQLGEGLFIEPSPAQDNS